MKKKKRRKYSLVRFYDSHFEDIISLDLYNNSLGKLKLEGSKID